MKMINLSSKLRKDLIFYVAKIQYYRIHRLYLHVLRVKSVDFVVPVTFRSERVPPAFAFGNFFRQEAIFDHAYILCLGPIFIQEN